MKKILLIPFKTVSFALKHDMYEILFPVAVWIAALLGGIASGSLGKSLLAAVEILVAVAILKAAWNRIQRIGGESMQKLRKRLRKQELHKELISYLMK